MTKIEKLLKGRVSVIAFNLGQKQCLIARSEKTINDFNNYLVNDFGLSISQSSIYLLHRSGIDLYVQDLHIDKNLKSKFNLVINDYNKVKGNVAVSGEKWVSVSEDCLYCGELSRSKSKKLQDRDYALYIIGSTSVKLTDFINLCISNHRYMCEEYVEFLGEFKFVSKTIANNQNNRHYKITKTIGNKQFIFHFTKIENFDNKINIEKSNVSHIVGFNTSLKIMYVGIEKSKDTDSNVSLHYIELQSLINDFNKGGLNAIR